METFKNAVRKIVRDEARSKGSDDPLFLVADLFRHFRPGHYLQRLLARHVARTD